jgi:hypothetical protein
MRKMIIGIYFLVLLMTGAIILGQSAPQLINFQGRLTDTLGQPLDGQTVDLTFTFYATESGGTVYLTVLQEDVLVIGGIYSLLIGSGTITPGAENTLAELFNRHQDVWMGVQVNSDPEMVPRSRITSVPYALRSSSVNPAVLLDELWNDPDHDQDGYRSMLIGGLDCHDAHPQIYPGSTSEVPCDGIDQDCDTVDIGKLGPETRVTNELGDGFSTSLAWTGSEFGVAWHDGRNGTDEIYFARIASDGDTIGLDIRITTTVAESRNPSLTWTGSEFGVVWHDDRDGNWEVYFALISSTGAKIGPDLRVTSDAASSASPQITWASSEFGISWFDQRNGNREIYFSRVSSIGDKIGTDVRVTISADDSRYPTITWTGTEYGVSWYDMRDGNPEIYFARLSTDGSKVGSDLRLTNDSNSSYYPSIAWSDSEFGIGWQDNMDGNQEIYFTRVSSGGTLIGPSLRVTNDTSISSELSLIWTGTEYGLVWQDDRDGNTEIYLARVSSASFKIGPDLRITKAPAGSRFPSLAWTDSEFGTGWDDTRDGNREIYFARVKTTCP